MKRALLTLLFLIPFTVNAAQVSTPSLTSVGQALEVLTPIVENTEAFDLIPGSLQDMVFDHAYASWGTDRVDFDENWVGNDSSAWEVDSGNSGYTDEAGARSYIENYFKMYDEDARANDIPYDFERRMAEVAKAFAILHTDSNIAYGVSATGATQCGVIFPSLLIINLKTGETAQIIMEGSGC